MATATESDALKREHNFFMQKNQHDRWLKSTLKAFDEMCSKGSTKWPSWFKGNIAAQKATSKKGSK